MSPHVHIRSLPPKGAECLGSEPARAGLDGAKSCCISQQCGLQGRACFKAARRRA